MNKAVLLCSALLVVALCIQTCEAAKARSGLIKSLCEKCDYCKTHPDCDGCNQCNECKSRKQQGCRWCRTGESVGECRDRCGKGCRICAGKDGNGLKSCN